MNYHPSLAVAPERPREQGAWRTARTLAFPLATNIWLVLLYVSQKVFVLPGLVLAGFGDAAYRRDLLLAFFISIVAIVVYLTQYANGYDQVHLLGFLPFVWAMPLVNHAVRHNTGGLLRLLTYLTLFNALMGLYILVRGVDLYGLRGLNKIEGTDGVTYRVYFESACLAAVFLTNAFNDRLLRIAAFAIVAYFVLFITKSVVIMALLGLNLVFPYLMRSRLHVKVIMAIVGAVVATLVFIYLPVIRPDIDLSLRVKQYQLQIIASLMPDNWTGMGWGFFLPQLMSDREQPYQVEMQLPMLLLQIGPIALAVILALIMMLFVSASERRERGLARFLVYLLIGFNNPWLFLPSWFLTCQLLFREEATAPKVPGGAADHR